MSLFTTLIILSPNMTLLLLFSCCHVTVTIVVVFIVCHLSLVIGTVPLSSFFARNCPLIVKQILPCAHFSVLSFVYCCHFMVQWLLSIDANFTILVDCECDPWSCPWQPWRMRHTLGSITLRTNPSLWVHISNSFFHLMNTFHLFQWGTKL